MSIETRFTHEEALSPQAAFDGAIKDLQELDANSLDIATRTGAKPIHDVFVSLVNDPSLEDFRVFGGKRKVVGIKSSDQRVIVSHTNDGFDSARSGIEIVTVSSEQFARGSRQVEKIEFANVDGKYHPRNWSENYASVSVNEVFPESSLNSVMLGEKVSTEKTSITRIHQAIKEPEELVEHLVRSLGHAREKFLK